MTAEPHLVKPHFDGDRLVLEEHREADHVRYLFPGTATGPAGPLRALTLTEALHARIGPAGTAEAVLRAWAQGAGPAEAVEVKVADPSAVPPVRVRAGAIVIRDGHLLLIHFREPDEGGPHYEIPGGGVEAGETPEEAAVRELREETGLHGSVERKVARVWKEGRHEHYFLLTAEGGIGPAETLDTYGGTPVWIPVPDLPALPLWPRRLSWRIEHWLRTGWPTPPAELADSVTDLQAPCTW
ncbi:MULTISPECIES: NUDIX domain-containing protein [unclassified Streptomyces]|uniref:NUDIX domain-containing protein n=1 Tax=unclassified Streptomyces TaxID=2593676 RepID=UPI000823BC1D|nr:MULTISPECIES: NUDIX domain-containing protein [unclassified Streptomyces]MYT99759.1 NUDIX domain-containing protein [Streptomyces sp. SID8350]SCK40222.1 ADP-ribose pyrophosphatase YjhB, NUDIX family [Streptomyces sp. AmelKG-D3]